MTYAVADGIADREQSLQLMAELLATEKTRPRSEFPNLVAGTMLDLNPVEYRAVLEQAFQTGLIGMPALSKRDLEDAIEEREEAALEQLRSKMQQLMPDVFHNRISWWACFRDLQQQQRPSRSVAANTAAGPSRAGNRDRNRRRAARKSRRINRSRARVSRKG